MSKKDIKKSREDMSFHGQSMKSGNTVPGINNPEIELPAYNPPVPNRAWTAMRDELGKDLIDSKSQDV